MSEIHVFVDASGPLFDGRAAADMARYAHNLEQILGERAVDMIRVYLPTQYMYLGHHGGDPVHNPIPPNAGYYQSQIYWERATDEHVLVRDDLVVYGPWLEGVSARNLIYWPGRVARGLSGRFPGYHTFRVIAQVLDDIATDIAYAELPPYIMEMND